MTDRVIIDWPAWTDSPPGRYVLDWEHRLRRPPRDDDDPPPWRHQLHRPQEIRLALRLKPHVHAAAVDLIAFTRLKDWIKLLGFDLERGRFGCYRPPLASEQWLSRYGFMEAAGDRWWPIFGATYMIKAIKRVRGMRLVGPLKVKKPVLAAGLAPAATPNTRNHTE